MKLRPLVDALGHLLFTQRRFFLALFILITLALGYSATRINIDAGYSKLIPLEHEYMKTFTGYQKTFGGANRVLVALRQKEGGDIFNPEFFKALKAVTDDVFFIPGIDRATVTSLFTPNVRFIEVIEEGFSGGNVIHAEFSGTPEDLARVRGNVLKSGFVGRLVANDFKGALVSAELLEIDPASGKKLNYAEVAQKLEDIRAKYQNDKIDVHIIGFAKAVGDIVDGAIGVLLFFLIAFLITAVLLYWYCGSLKMTGLALACAMIPVVWLLGLLSLLGKGIDPISILVPFLIFSIGVSHAVQMTNAWTLEVLHGADGLTAARNSFFKLFIPGAMALLANALGFLVVMTIKIDIVQELAITASLGVALMIITNKMFLTILLSYMHVSPQKLVEVGSTETGGDWLWSRLKHLAQPRNAKIVLVIAALLLTAGAWKARDLRTGDLGKGIPELHDDSRYNRDTAAIVDSFSIGVDVLSVIAQSRDVDGACTDYELMNLISRFETTLRNVHGVQGVQSLPGVARAINAGWNEGNLRWRVLSRHKDVLAQSVTPVDTSTGLLNTDCSAMQVLIFTRDHQGTTIAHIVEEVKKFAAANKSDKLEFLLASGNVGVMAATNEAVDAAEVTMLVLLFGSIGLLCFIEFRSLTAVLCIILPLAVVSVLCNAFMAILGIGVGTWAFSALKFQADMGILLAFMFLVNMLGAIFLLPALAAVLLKKKT